MREVRKALPTVTSVMWHPTPTLRQRWLREYGKDRFSFEEALVAQSFPKSWIFPDHITKRWKWLGEAFPPKVAEYLFRQYAHGENLVLLDLFAGIGGWGLGAYYCKRFKRIIMVEIDKEKCKYLRLNFERLGIDFEVICGDVRKVDYSTLGRVDVVSASPPCEDLTILKCFNYNPTRKGTVPLTLFTLELVDELRPRVAFYENVYRKLLARLLSKHGWRVMRFDMSKIIPQKRVRLIGVRSFSSLLLQ